MSSLTVVSGQERNSYQCPGSVICSRQLYSRNTVNISPDSPSPARCSIPHHAAELSSTLANIQLEWRKIWRWNRCVSVDIFNFLPPGEQEYRGKNTNDNYFTFKDFRFVINCLQYFLFYKVFRTCCCVNKTRDHWSIIGCGCCWRRWLRNCLNQIFSRQKHRSTIPRLSLMGVVQLCPRPWRSRNPGVGILNTCDSLEEKSVSSVRGFYESSPQLWIYQMTKIANCSIFVLR